LEKTLAMTYSQQLADPRWQRRRLERLSLADFSCDECGSRSEQLHVHHRHYFKGRKAWEYDDQELQVLCKPCHSAHHRAESTVKQALSESCIGDAVFLGLLAGFLDASMELDVEGSGLLADVSADGVIAGRMAAIFFGASRQTQAKMAEAVLGCDRRLSPVETETLQMVIACGARHDQ
jgi:hypothetical protein